MLSNVLLAMCFLVAGCGLSPTYRFPTPIPTPTSTPPVINQDCQLKPEAGQCAAYFERYFYNQDTKQCEKFIWGGCAGVVPFQTLKDCQSSCTNTGSTNDERMTVNLGENFQIKIGQTIFINNENIKITLSEITADSRCPKDVMCVWEGQVEASFGVIQNNISQLFSLITHTAKENLVEFLDNYQAQLVEVRPEKESGYEIKPADYVLTVVVTKK